MNKTPIRSMTGFGSFDGTVCGSKMRMEIKALNHRFLDIKLRLPRELSSVEFAMRALVQSHFTRGSVDLKLESAAETENTEDKQIQANLALAAQYYECLVTIQKALGLTDPIRAVDVATYPEIVVRKSPLDIPASENPNDLWMALEPLAKAAIGKLTEMREHEGAALSQALLQALEQFDHTIDSIRNRREQWESSYRKKMKERISAVFEAYPLADSSIQTVLETRIAQELAIILDRTDIEEELTRFKGHIDHFRKVLTQGGPVGRKLDFILQEMGREINTLGNKAQDLGISEEVVQVKVRLEQLREQVMNLE